ncbi:MAG: hypothetical protein SO231_05775, partial [Phocaeicola vulgatus]|nr:hypothetical protein [Phocaeicola vulgatus]
GTCCIVGNFRQLVSAVGQCEVVHQSVFLRSGLSHASDSENVSRFVVAIIYTQKITAQLQLDLDKHNDQSPIDVRSYWNGHNKLLIIDGTEVYHIGTSLKDLGKNVCFFQILYISYILN